MGINPQQFSGSADNHAIPSQAARNYAEQASAPDMACRNAEHGGANVKHKDPTELSSARLCIIGKKHIICQLAIATKVEHIQCQTC